MVNIGSIDLFIEKEVNGQLKTHERQTNKTTDKTRIGLKTLSKLVDHITTEPLRPFNCNADFSSIKKKNNGNNFCATLSYT